MTPTDRWAEIGAALMAWAPHYGFDLVPVEVVIAQSHLETAGWTSNLCVNYNNAFGMMMPRRRETVAIGEVPAEYGAGFAVYESLTDSAQDYWLRQREFGIPNTSDPLTYIEATVASGYAMAPDYADRWISRINADPGNTVIDADEPGGILVPLLIAATAWAITR